MVLEEALKKKKLKTVSLDASKIVSGELDFEYNFRVLEQGINIIKRRIRDNM